jgi:hypothetical protein
MKTKMECFYEGIIIGILIGVGLITIIGITFSKIIIVG